MHGRARKSWTLDTSCGLPHISHMRHEFSASIAEARATLGRFDDEGFTLAHTRSVVALSRRVAVAVNTASSRGVGLGAVPTQPSGGAQLIDPDLIELAAWWHDSGRLYDPDHEAISARLAVESLERLAVEKATRDAVFQAIEHHRWSMTPQTLAGEVLRDGDKLDWVSATRWRLLIERKRWGKLAEFADSLAEIRGEILHLNVSRTIFDEMVADLKHFAESVDIVEFLPIRTKLLRAAGA